MNAPFQSPFVVLPTYNERENISAMIRTLFELPVPSLSILVVDDSSPDGTQEVISSLQKNYSRLHLLSRPKKEGLGRAYVAGFKEVLKRGADCVIQMDCDFSHDPNDVPRLIQALGEADLAVGSRYITGGRTKNWPSHRLFLSKFANIYANFVTKMPVFDSTAGFKGWRGECLKKIDLEEIRTNGYGFQIETSYRAYRQSSRIKEIPITYTERRNGLSKMSKKIIWEAMWLVWKLRKN